MFIKNIDDLSPYDIYDKSEICVPRTPQSISKKLDCSVAHNRKCMPGHP